MVSIDELEQAVSRIADVVGHSVVGLGHRWAIGSGIVVADGLVLTNAHNLRGTEVGITFTDGRKAEATARGVDFDADIAVLSADTGDVPAIGWDGAAADVTIGKPVFALSNPGGRGLRVTFGLVSGTDRSFRGPRGRRIGGSVEHTAPLLPGSSGGPVVDASGALLGVNTNRLGEGFYLAIPATAALKGQVDALKRGEAPQRPRLGVGLAPAEVARGLRRAVGLDEVEGLLVRTVEDGGPASSAGIKEGDLITEAAGRPVATFDDLYEALSSAAAEIQLKLLRGAEERTVTASLR